MDQPRLFIKDPQDNLITVISEGYFNVELTSYLTGAATTLSFSFVKDEDSYEQIVTGCKVAFIYKGKDYWMNIVRVSQDEDIMTVTAWGVSLELSNETVAPYKATKPMSFAEYANLWNYENTFEIGINEVSDKKITHEWEGADKTLGRLLSLATVFDAEVEFVTYLDDFHNLDKLVMNVYKAHSETNQGLGLDSRQMVFRFGNEIETVYKEESAEELYTAITPTGKDGLNISSIEFEKFDADGNLEFCTYKTAKPNFPDVRKIYAPLAKLRHPSYRGQTRDEWTNFNWETEYTTANDLSGNALSKLKSISVPEFTWDIVGVIDAGIGDTVTIEDDGYEPTLYLEARVSEQTIDFSDESKNKTTFTNVLEVGSAVDMSLLSRMEALIESNKTYVGSIQTTNGIVFKNNTGTTDLTAVVRIGTQTVTDDYDISWYKDGTEIANTATITVTATEVVEKALYKFEAKDSEGVVVASYEVTVSDVSDGEEGRGISSTKVEYQASTSGTTVPTGTWLTSPPSVTDGQFLWTRTTFTYTDNTTTLSYSISRMGTTGTNGVGISDVTVTYQAGTSGTTPPTGTWTTSIPSVTANQYLWTRTVVTYTDSSTSTAYSVGKMGANGADAQLLYLSSSANVMKFDSNDIVEPNQTVTITAKLQNATGTIVWTAIPYIGNAAQTPITLTGTGNTRTLASENWKNAAWTSVSITATLGSLTDTLSIVKVSDGANGIDGIAGKDGVGLNSTTITYAQSTSGTTAPTSSWSAQVPTLVKGQYLWTRTVWTYTDASTETGYTVSYNAKDGNDGEDGIAGKDGVGISSTVIEYVGAVSGTSKPTSGWSTTIPTVPAGQYLWTRTTWQYTDGTSEQGFTNALMGRTGANGKDGVAGKDGVGIKSTQIMYAQSTSGTTPPTTGWTEQVPTLIKGQYLWTQTTWVYTDNTGESGYTVSYNAKDGNNGTDGIAGKDGVGISNTKIEYVGSTSGTTRPTSGWSTTIPTVAEDNFLWTRTTWTYTDSTSEVGYSVAKMGAKGDKGDKGDPGNQGIPGTPGVDGKTPYTHWAYAWSADGKDRFTTSYPNENEFINKTIQGIQVPIHKDSTSGGGSNGRISLSLTEDGGLKIVTTEASDPYYRPIAVVSGAVLGNTPRQLTFDYDIKSGNFLRVRIINFYLAPGGTSQYFEGKGTATIDMTPDDSASTGHFISFDPVSNKDSTYTVGDEVILYNIKFSAAPSGIYTPAPADDFANAYPTFAGTYVDYEPTDSEDPTKYTWQRILGESGQDGKDGIAGKDGVGVSDTNITYAQSTSGTTPPTTGWTTSVPTLVKGQYLWTRTIWYYTDSTNETGYTVSYNAKDGNDGTDGIAGKDGVGISATVIEYAASTSGTVKPTTGWSTTIPTVAQGQYLWTRTTWKYTDSTSEQGYSVARQGANGTNGTNGTDGADGKDAQEVFSGYLTNESIVLPANAAGTVTDFSKANGTFVTFLGQNQLSAGVAYSLESATGITTTINATSGAYSVTAISADVGVAIYKAVYNGITIRKQVMVVRARQGATGANGTNGSDGKDGVGVTNTVITYQAGTSGTTAPTGTWSTTVPTVPEGQFLWTRTVWAFSDGTSKTGYSISKKGETGATGATGATGNGIASSAITYAASTSGTTVPTSGWQATIPTVAEGSFLWTRTIFTYTNGNTNTSYAVAKQGEKGDPTGILYQNTVPAAAQRYVGMLWKNTGAAGYINGATYRWNGSSFELYIFTAENMSVSNLAAISANLGTITAGTINGVTINGSEFINPYTRQYNDGTFAQGTQRIGSAELYNSGVIKNSQGTTTQSYEAIFSHQLVSMTRYSGESLGDQTKLIAAMGLTFDSLTLNNQQTGFAGTLTAEMLYDTGWLKVTRLKGTAGDIYLKRYMNRILIRFDGFVWDGSANGASTSNAVAILPDKVREGFPQMFTVPVWIEGNATEKFQVENGRLYKLSNNSGNSQIRAVGEVYI